MHGKRFEVALQFGRLAQMDKTNESDDAYSFEHACLHTSRPSVQRLRSHRAVVGRLRRATAAPMCTGGAFEAGGEPSALPIDESRAQPAEGSYGDACRA